MSFHYTANTNFKFPAVLFIYLYFNKAEKSIIQLSKSIGFASKDNEYNIEIKLDTTLKKLLKRDVRPIIYLALAGCVPFKKKIYWTNTVSAEL